MEPIYKDNEFEALKLRYTDQVELLRSLTQFDFRIFTSFFTIQLVLSGWLSANPVPTLWMKAGFLLIDISLAFLSIKLLYNQHCRRQEVVNTIKNCNEALGYTRKGVYLADKVINAPTMRRYWFKWYVTGVIVATVGFSLLLFGLPTTKALQSNQVTQKELLTPS